MLEHLKWVLGAEIKLPKRIFAVVGSDVGVLR